MSDTKKPEELLELNAGESYELLPKPEELLELVPPPPEGLLVAPHEVSSDTSAEPTVSAITPEGDDTSLVPETVTESEALPPGSTEVSVEPSLVVSNTSETESEMLDDAHLFDSVEDIQVTSLDAAPETISVTVDPDFSAGSAPSIVPDTAGAPDAVVVSDVGPEATPTVGESQNITPAVDIPVPPTLSSIPSIPFEPANPIVPTASPTSHKKLIIIGGSALVIVTGALLYLVFGGTDDTTSPTVEYTISAEAEPTQTYEQTKEQVLNTQEQDIETYNTAVKQRDKMLCANISDTQIRTGCTEDIALVEISAIGTMEDCATLTLDDTKARCETTMTQKEAEKTMNKALCANIKDADQAQYCREQIDEIVVANLIESKTATMSGCGQLEKKFQEACLASIARIDDKSILDSALATDNLEKCQTLSTEDLQVACFDSVLLKRALANGDKSVCELIRDQTKQDACLGKANAMNDNDIFKKAIVDKDINLCGTISTKTLADKCHDSVTMLVVRDTRNLSLCDTLKNPASLENCRKLGGAQ